MHRISRPLSIYRNIKQARASSIRHASTVSSDELQVWSEEIRRPLDKVSSMVSEAIKSVGQLRPEEPIWLALVDTMSLIQAAPSKHLLRPQLVILGSSAGGILGKSERVDRGILRFAAGTELLHLHTSCYDDIREHATIRRHVPTLPIVCFNQGIENYESRTHLSTIVCEILNVKAYEYMMKGAMTICEELGVSNSSRRGICMSTETVMKGSFMASQARFSDAIGWRAMESRWNEVAKGDTSARHEFMRQILIEKGAYSRFVTPLEAGLRLSSVSESVISVANEWSARAGIALEALNQVNVLISNPLETGKDPLQDIRAGRFVLPLYFILDSCSKSEFEEIVDIFLTGDNKFTLNPPVSTAERKVLLQLVKKYEVVPKCLEFIEKEIKFASNIVHEKLHESLPTPGLLRVGLSRITDGLADHLQELKAESRH